MRTPLLKAFKVLLVTCAAVALVVAGQGRPQPAYAAITLTVDNFTDLHAAGGATTCTPGVCTLRAALEIADNRAAILPDLNTTINIPTATITLTLGALQVGTRQNQVITITGNGSANTAINMGPCVEGGIAASCSVLLLDPTTVGRVTAHISGLKLNGGHTASVAGGAGLQAGSIDPLNPDDTDLSDVIISNNTVTGGNPGGGISYAQGALTIVNSTISGNTTDGNGGGLDFFSDSVLTITNSTFSTNSSTQAGTGGGGGIHTMGAGTYDIADSTFTGNTANSSLAGGGGGGIFSESGTLLHLTHNTFLNNTASPNANGGAVFNRLGNATMHNNRFAGNTALTGKALYANAGTIDAQNNWWSTNTPNAGNFLAGPAVTGGNAPTRWYLLRLNAPTTLAKNTSTPITADLGHDNTAGTGNSLLALLNVTTIGVTWPPATLGTVSGAAGNLNGSSQAGATFTAGGTPGTAHVFTTIDGFTLDTPIEIPGPPTIAKAFGAASIPVNGTTSLTLTLTNPNAVTTLTGIQIVDGLPGGFAIATPNGLTGSCPGGTISAVAGGTVISMTGASLAPGATCSFSVNVRASNPGGWTNTTGNVSANESGAGGTASANLAVVAPPVISKNFTPTSTPRGTTTSLQFIITNPGGNTVALTGVGFSDTLPAGLTVASASSSVCGGTLTTTAPTGISLSGATIAASTQCIFPVTVTGAATGVYTNTTGTVTSTNGGPGNTGSADLTVVGPPNTIKAFGAATIPLNGTTSLIFTITNPNSTTQLNAIAFTDNFPAGLVVANPANASNTGCHDTFTAIPGANNVSLGNGFLAPNASCTLSVDVTGTTAGVKSNSVQLTSQEGGAGNTANASITVVAPPSMAKAFGAASIPLNGTTTLSFTIANPNTASGLTGVGFSDSLPAGLVVAAPPNVTGSCGSGTITATAGSGTISLSGGTLTASPGAGSSCTFSVNVTGTTAGTKNNTSGAVTSTEGGTGNAPSASVNVVAPPALAKVFNPGTIALNATTSLQFTITNPAGNTVTLTGVAFSDTLPTGLTVASASATVCGGTLTTTAPTGIALSGASIAAAGQCVFSVTVTGAAGGSYTNTTGTVSSTNGGTGNTASANLQVGSPPTITKAFQVPAMAVNTFTSLTFNILNPNSSLALTGIAFSDSLPAGLVVSTPNGLVNNCGGTVTAVAGSSTVSLSGGAIAGGGACQVRVDVTGTTTGVKSNTSGAVSATESGPGATSNTATITITSITLASSNNPATEGSTSVIYTAQVQPTPPTGTVTFFDGVNPIAGCSGLAPNPGGVATCNVGIYPTAGSHSIHATYSVGNAISNVVVEVVSDAPLTAVAGGNITGTESFATGNVVLATFTDANPNGVAADFTANVSWGDGTYGAGTVTAATGGGFQVTGGHTYDDAGTYPILVFITDTKGGSTASATLSATIADVLLQITCTQNLNATAGQQFSGQVATVFDPSNKEPLSEYTITIDWGDGTTSNATFTDPPGTLLVNGSHTYAAAGTYTMTVTARENDPNAAAAVAAAASITVAALPATSAPGRPIPFGVLLAAILALALAVGLWLTSHRRRRRL